MAVKSSGSLSISTDIVGEFGGSTPHSLSEYKRGGSYVPNVTANNDIPTTNSNIQFSDFYGAVKIVDASSVITPVTINGQSTAKQITVSSYISSGGVFEIPSTWWIWSDNISTPALLIDIPCTIINNGKIIGRGGNGGRASYPYAYAQAGGPAIKINSSVSGVIIQNKSGAYIAGGGGGGGSSVQDGYSAGGGGGAGGGNGANSNSATGGAGGAINAVGSNGANFTDDDDGGLRYYYGGRGGQAGGGGGMADYDGGHKGASPGGGGGRILPGALGSALTNPGSNWSMGAGRGGGENWNQTAGYIQSSAHGGYAGNAAPNYTGAGGSGGGGGWGAKGGNARDGSYATGGAGGKAIEDSGNSYTLTNNGTIYGATT